MNIFKWLKSKSGKMPITFTQAVGIAAVVGAAGFGAMSFLGSSEDNNNTFLPPTAPQEQVVYVAQNGGGRYEANGEVASSFKATPSRSLQLANQQAERAEQARALEEASQQMPSFGAEDAPAPMPLPQAYQLTGADLRQGLGGGKNKDLNIPLDTFSTVQNQLGGVTQALNNAQTQGNAGGPTTGAPAGTDGQSAGQVAGAPRNWGNNGLTRAGGGGGSSNAFVIQNSGKNKREDGPQVVDEPVQQPGDAIAQAQAAIAQLQEGTRIQSRANFGRSDGITKDKDARMSPVRRFTNAKAELEFIRKHSAAISRNKTNAGNAGGEPFFASNRISGGLVVDGEQVTTGQSSNSKDLSHNFDRAMGNLRNNLEQLQANMDERQVVRDELRSWIWKLLTVGLVAVVAIAALVHIARTGPWGWWAWAAAAAATAAALFYIWYNTANKVNAYTNLNDSDGWVIAGWALSGLMTAGIGLAWFWGVSKLGAKLKDNFSKMLEKLTGKVFKHVQVPGAE